MNDNVDTIEKVVEELNKLEIKPATVIKLSNLVQIGWTGPLHQVVTNRESYIKLLTEFIIYLNSITNMDIQFDYGMLMDDPGEFDFKYCNGVNINPTFSKEFFSYDEDIEVIDLSTTGK